MLMASIMIMMMTTTPTTTRAFLSCNKEPLRGHDSTQDLAASIEAEALLAKVHHHLHHHHASCSIAMIIHISIIMMDIMTRLEVGRGVEAVQEQGLRLLTRSTQSKCFLIMMSVVFVMIVI